MIASRACACAGWAACGGCLRGRCREGASRTEPPCRACAPGSRICGRVRVSDSRMRAACEGCLRGLDLAVAETFTVRMEGAR